MWCPFCKQKLNRQTAGYYTCPDSHGVLLSSRLLADMAQLQERRAPQQTNRMRHHPIICPQCGNRMAAVDYKGTGVMIDSCTHCHSRWLDSGELHKIQTHKPTFKPEDLLLLLDIDTATDNEKARKNPNPQLPLQGSYRTIASINGETRLGGIFGAGFYGLARGLKESGLSRILILTTLGAFIILFLLVIKSAGSL
jgi:Zn-finger nucleic acid-binding protein